MGHNVLELDYTAHSPVWLSNHAQSEAMHNMSVHQLTQYYQPEQGAWTAFVMWYIAVN